MNIQNYITENYIVEKSINLVLRKGNTGLVSLAGANTEKEVPFVELSPSLKNRFLNSMKERYPEIKDVEIFILKNGGNYTFNILNKVLKLTKVNK